MTLSRGAKLMNGATSSRLGATVGGLKDVFFNFLVALANLVLFLLQERFEFFHVGLHGVREISELERQNIGVGETDDGGRGGLSESAAVDEFRIAEVGEPVEIIVDGMVDAAAVFSTVADVEGRDAVVLNKRAVVGARAERTDAEIGAVACFRAVLGAGGGGDGLKLRALPDGKFCFRVLNVAGDIVDEFLECVGTLGVEIAAAVGVGIDVNNRVLHQLVAVVFHPFGGADEAGLFAIPRAIDDGALGLPAGFQKFAEGTSFFKFRNQAGDWVFGAVDPGVVMVAANDPLVGIRAAGNSGDDVIDGLEIPIGSHFQVDFERAGAGVISEWKIAAPLGGHYWADECGEQGLRVAIRNGQHGNLGDDGRIFDLQALGVFFRGYAGSKRVAGINGIVGHAAALHAVAWTEAALGKSFAWRIAVAFGIGIDDAADGAVFRGNLGLDAAPGVAVAGDGDRAFDGNAEAFEALVILGDAVIDVDERRDDVAIFGESVVGGQLLGFLAGGGINSEGGLLEFRGKFHGAAGGGRAFAVEQF